MTGPLREQVRYLALLLVDEIFRRSALFRGLLVPALETFLELTVGTRTDKPLPDPRAAAKRLQVGNQRFDVQGIRAQPGLGDSIIWGCHHRPGLHHHLL